MTLRRLHARPTIQKALGIATLCAAVSSELHCGGPKQLCDDVQGSCLELRLDGIGSYSSAEIALVGSASDLKKGDLPGFSSVFPVEVRVVPPPGLNTSALLGVRIDARNNGMIVASGQTVRGFSWPDGAHVSAAVLLNPVTPQDIPPGPLLKWNAEITPVRAQLFDVYAYTNAGTDVVIAAGANGVALSRTITGSWVAETTGTTGLFTGIYGFPLGNIFGVTQASSAMSAAWKRDAAAPTWTKETVTPPMPGGKGFWCAAAGATVGEVWAGDDDGKVWHRSTSGMWASEQALPLGIGVYGVAQAEGSIFAVGDAGNVAYRRDSTVGTPWMRTQITQNVMPTDWFNGVWAFDKGNAVAIGTNGLLARFSSGTWSAGATKIDANNTELFGVWGMTPSRVWAVGRSGLILRVDDQKVYKLYSQNGIDLQAIYGLSDSNIYAVGGNASPVATILHGTPY